MAAYYNEFDPYAAQWLRNLIAAGHIAPGEVDERSICDVDSADLAGFTQCHFFAGIGVWSRALRLAGWPDDRPVWTGSCPCQPFSAAGKRGGFDDERHLWPELFRLVRERRPAVVFGEQVASKDGLQWLDAVQADLEGAGYASAAADLCAAGVGAPHIRQRLYWVADACDQRHERDTGTGREAQRGFEYGSDSGRMANNNNKGLEGRRQPGCERGTERAAGPSGVAGGLADAEHDDGRANEQRWGPQGRIADGRSGAVVRLADAEGAGSSYGRSGSVQPVIALNSGAVNWMADADVSITQQFEGERARPCEATSAGAHDEFDRRGELVKEQSAARPTNGFWADADWLHCRDGKWRPVEPGTFPLAHGATARVGRLRAYGNAIVPQVAQTFVEAFMECRP